MSTDCSLTLPGHPETKISAIYTRDVLVYYSVPILECTLVTNISPKGTESSILQVIFVSLALFLMDMVLCQLSTRLRFVSICVIASKNVILTEFQIDL